MKKNLELFERLRNKFPEKTFITWSYALQELWIINREAQDLDIVINNDFHEVQKYLDWLKDNSSFKFDFLNDLDEYWQWDYIKLKMSDWTILDILYLQNIDLEWWFIHPKLILENKKNMVVFYENNTIIGEDTRKKIYKHQQDIIKIEEYLKLF